MIRKMLLYYKKNNILLFMVAMFVSAFLMNILSTYCSVQEMLVEDVAQIDGRWNVCIRDTSENIKSGCLSLSDVKQIGIETEKKAELYSLSGRQADSGTLSLRYMNQAAMSLCVLKLYKGRLPQNRSEIVVSFGMKINDEYVYQGDYIGKTICLKNSSQEYCIVGILDNMNASSGNENNECILLGNDGTSGNMTLYLELANNHLNFFSSNGEVRKSCYEITKFLGFSEDEIYDWQRIRENGDSKVIKEDYPIWLNNELLMVLEHGNSGQTIRMVQYVSILFGLMILLIGGFMTAGITISDYQKRRSDHALFLLCGSKLSTIKKQYFIEKEIIFITASLSGIFLGRLLQLAVAEIVQQHRTTMIENLHIRFLPWSAVISFLLIVAISSLSVVISFSKWKALSPMDALYQDRRNDVEKIFVPHHFEVGKGILPLTFQIGMIQVLRRKLSAIICILCVAMAAFLFICFCNLSLVINQIASQQEEKNQFQFFAFANEIPKLEQLKNNIPYTDECNVSYDTNVRVVQNQNILTEESVKWYGKIYDSVQDSFSVDVVAVDRYFYDTYLQGEDKPSYDILAEQNGCVYDDACLVPKENNAIHILKDIKGKEIELKGEGVKGKKQTCKLVLNTRVKRHKVPLPDDFQPTIYVPYEVFFSSFTPFFVMVHINAVTDCEKEVQAWLMDHAGEYGISVQDNLSEYQETRDTVSMVRVIMEGVLILTTLVALICIISTLKSSMDRQSGDLVIMQALGMKKEQIFDILFSESMIYVLTGLIIGIIATLFFAKQLIEMVSCITIVKLGMAYYPFALCTVGAIVIAVLVTLMLVSKFTKDFSLSRQRL